MSWQILLMNQETKPIRISSHTSMYRSSSLYGCVLISFIKLSIIKLKPDSI